MRQVWLSQFSVQTFIRDRISSVQLSFPHLAMSLGTSGQGDENRRGVSTRVKMPVATAV